MSFRLSEPLPHGACAVLVREDFIEVPLHTERLWLDSLYVMMATAPGGDNAKLCLQAGGLLWVTNSVWQGAGSHSRAFDVSTRQLGRPKLYVGGTAVTTFERLEAPGMLIWSRALVTLQNVTFRNTLVDAPDSRGAIDGAIAVRKAAGLLLPHPTGLGTNARIGREV
eukprot:jgi/Ulvmu1/891/UM100_0046.1